MNISLIHILAGTWFIVQTNFPLWLKGDKLNPTFNYTIIQKKGRQVLLDEVKYEKKGKEKTITGIDYPEEKNENSFTWKGKGLLFIARSKWEVKLIDTEEGWAVIYFSKTLFTPAGVDIISRKPTISAEILKKIKTEMEKDPVLHKHLSSLKVLK